MSLAIFSNKFLETSYFQLYIFLNKKNIRILDSSFFFWEKYTILKNKLKIIAEILFSPQNI